MTAEPAASQGSWSGVSLATGNSPQSGAVIVDHTGVLDVVDVPIVVMGGDFTIAGFNRAAAEAFALVPSDLGRSASEISTFSAIPRLHEWCTEVAATSLPRRRDFRDNDKSYIVRIASYTSNEREIFGTVLTFTNVTAFRASIDQAIYEREYTKAVLNTVGDPLIVLSTDLLVQSANRAFFSMFGLSRDGIQGASLAELEQGVFAGEQVRDGLQALLAGDRQFHPFEIEHTFPAVGARCLMLDARLYSMPGRATRLILLTLQDITDLKCIEKTLRIEIIERSKAEQAHRLLVEEMKHRVKNSLATVQAIASQSLRSAPENERAAFVARLHALANAHDVLTQENWQRAPLRDIVNQALMPFGATRFTTAGPYVPIAANKSLQLTMALHELATNAVKYGALSNATGQVHIDWTVLDDQSGARLRICWEERGGPPVQPIDHKGFGSKLIEVSVEKSEVIFGPEGVSCVLEITL
jgi:two-component system CheB/CheR fusion protein